MKLIQSFKPIYLTKHSKSNSGFGSPLLSASLVALNLRFLDFLFFPPFSLEKTCFLNI